MINEKVLIEMLEEVSYNHFDLKLSDAKAIINKLAEESNLTPCYLGSPCEYQNEEAKMPPTLLDYITFVDDNNGWIPCSERLPDKRDWYLAMFQEHNSDFVLVPRVADFVGIAFPSTTYEGWLIIDLEDRMTEYYKKLKCIAWMPLPAPYKGEQK